VQPLGKPQPLFADETLEAATTIEERPVKVEEGSSNAFKHHCFDDRSRQGQRS
jgi:hypothetical protein